MKILRLPWSRRDWNVDARCSLFEDSMIEGEYLYSTCMIEGEYLLFVYGNFLLDVLVHFDKSFVVYYCRILFFMFAKYQEGQRSISISSINKFFFFKKIE